LIISYKNQRYYFYKVAAWKKKWANKWGLIKKISGELRISFRTKF